MNFRLWFKVCTNLRGSLNAEFSISPARAGAGLEWMSGVACNEEKRGIVEILGMKVEI